MNAPIGYTADDPNGRPATDDEIRQVLPPELYDLWQAGAFEDDE